MTHTHKMTIARKLALAFGSLILLTTILGSLAITILISIDISYTKSFEDNAQHMPYMSDIIQTTSQLRLDVSSLVMNSDNPAAVKDHRAIIEEGKAGCAKAFKEAHEKIKFKEDLRLFTSALEVYENSLLPRIDEILGVVETAKYPDLRKMIRPLNEDGLKIIKLLNNLIDREISKGIAISNHLSDLSNNLVSIFILMITLTIIISLFISNSIIKSISAPVAELKTQTEAVARGNLNVTVSYHSNDELGDLADSLQRTVDSLSEYIGEIKRALEALGHRHYDYQPGNVFKGDFKAIKKAIETIAGLLREQQAQSESQQAELRQAYDAANWANKAKSDFLSHMSHDIRTPMNAIIGLTDIAGNNLDKPAMVADCLKKISVSGTHLLGLINDVLDISKIERSQMSLHNDEVSLPELLETVINIIQPQLKAKRQTLDIRLHDLRHEVIFCDFLRLNQVLINILSNAVKFTPMLGRISLDIIEQASCEAEKAHFRFIFTDTGIGIKAEFLQNIFSAFARDSRKQVKQTEGSGLGMAICKKIVDLMGGTIKVKSEIGRGSVFTVDLCFDLPKTADEEMRLPALKILVIDDDAETGSLACQTLKSLGALPQYADNASQPAGMIEEALSRAAPYKAVILDCRWPEFKGLDTARYIREKIGVDSPIIIMAVYDHSDIEEEAKKIGVNGFLSKPLFKSTLYHGLTRVLTGEPARKKPELKVKVPDLTNKRILLVEDNEVNRMVARGFIAPTGATIDYAENGQKAVELFAESKPGTYDLILMDVQMPILNGYEATRLIRKLPRADAAEVTIVAMTASVFPEDIQAAGESGMNGHIAKPLVPAKLMRDLNKLLNQAD